MKLSKRLFSLLLAVCMTASMTACAPKAEEPAEQPAETPAAEQPAETPETEKPEVVIDTAMKPGTYTETVKGMAEGLVVEVAVSEKAIDSITIKENNETEGVADGALAQMPEEIVAAQSVNIETVAGATLTSNGIIEAVKAAITEAGGNVDEFSVDMKAKAAEVDTASLVFPPLPEAWDMSYDVVVVGGGFAGLAAAHTAQNAGAQTVLVEKMAATGGNSAINGGQYASYTSKIAGDLQKDLGLEPDTAEKHFEDTINGGDGMSDPALVNVMVNTAPKYLDILLDAGLQVRHTLARPGGHYGFRTYVTENSIGSDITNIQRDLVDKSGAEVMLETKMVELYRDNENDQKVVGIRVEMKDGSSKTIEAKKGVILATGGFSSNKEMRQLHVPYLTPDLPTTNNVCSTGEGIQIAQAVGANTVQMSYVQRYPWANPVNGVLDTYAVMPFTGPSYGVIYVDQDGNRYVNEGDRRDVCANAAIATGGVTTFSIFTREIASFSTDKDIQNGIEAGRILTADTIEELVAKINELEIKGVKMNMDAATLTATIDAHNGYIAQGTDPDFGKVMAKTMKPIENGPFYAIPQWPSVHHTMGGLAITPDAEVKDIYNNIIPGLYAAGEVTGGVHGTNRLGSNADADACSFGYVAGTVVSTGETPDFIPELAQ